jgi:DNA-binding YbaB/EbfC family protein
MAETRCQAACEAVTCADPHSGDAAVFDMMKMMKQVSEMQAKMQAMQESLGALEVTGTAGGGLVTVTMSGKTEMRSIVIDPSLLAPGEKAMLEDLIVAAVKDAQMKAQSAAQERMAEVTAGLPIPPGMLPGMKV